jgi:O-antigen ligase/tetratricopeptide (TPR) repeat protein
VTLRVVWLGIVGLATYAALVGGGWLGIYSPELRITSMVLSGVGLAAWIVVATKRPSWRPRSVLLPAVVACLASLTVSTIFSDHPRVSLEYLGYAWILAALYLLLVRLFDVPYFAARLHALAGILFAVIAGVFVILTAAHWVEWWTLVGHLTIPPLRPDHEGLTYLNPSAVLTMVALLGVPAAALSGCGSTLAKVRTAAIGLIICGVALLTGSRAGWLALGVTAVVMTGIWISSSERRHRSVTSFRTLWTRPTGRAVLLAFVLAIAGGAIAFGPAIVLRASEGGEDLRTTYMLAALRMFARAPFTGTGPGTWVIERPGDTATAEPDYYIPHAHNIEAQTLAELGIGGAIAGIVVVASVIWLLRDAIRDPRVERRAFGWATTAGLLYVTLHQQLDFYANMPAVLFAIGIPVAYLDATTMRAPVRVAGRLRWASALNRPAAIVGAAALAIALGVLIVQEIPAARMAAAVDAADHGDWVAAMSEASGAAQMDPAIDAYHLMAGLSASHLGDPSRAAAEFELVVRANDLPEAWLDLAAERQQLGDTSGATDALLASLRLGIQRPAIAVPAGELALKLGRTDIARTAFAAAIRMTPSLAADPWWHLDPDREGIYVQAVSDAIATAPVNARWEIAFMAGDVDQARTLGTVNDRPSVAAAFMDAWNGSGSATEQLVQQCTDNPFDTGALGRCARLAARIGDVDGAARWRRMSEILIGGSSRSGYELRIATTPSRSAVAGDPALFWSTFTYRRPGPADLLVPSLVHLTLE